MAEQMNVLVICGSLRKGSFNAAIDARVAGAGAAGDAAHRRRPRSTSCRSTMPTSHEASGFPPAAEALAAAIRAADARAVRLAGIQLVDPGLAEERHRLGLAYEGQAVQGKAGGDAVLLARPARRRAHAVSLAHGHDLPEGLHVRHAGGVRRQCRQQDRQGHARADRRGRPRTSSGCSSRRLPSSSCGCGRSGSARNFSASW